MSFLSGLGTIVIGILVFLGIFLILRIFWLWYWKINKIVDLLSIIREELIDINKNMYRGEQNSTP